MGRAVFGRVVLLIFSAFFPVLLVVLALAQEEVKITIKENRFLPEEVRVKAGSKVRLVVTNADAVVEEFESHDLNREKLIRPGQSVTILLPDLKPGVYEFFGEFHPETAKGRIIVE